MVDVAADQTLLAACLRAGVHLPHACNHGLCGTCKVTVLEGEVDLGAASTFALMDVEREEGKALACCATLRSDAVIEADIDEDPDALRLAVGDHVGRVVAAEMATPDTRRIRVAVPGFAFQAGQYVDVRIPGLERPRAFSMATAPSARGGFDLLVKRVPGGEGTGWLHDRLAVGDELAFAGPFGRFFVRRSAGKPILLLAGGSGISAIRSMLDDLLDDAEGPLIRLVYGARSERDLVGHAELVARAASTARLSYTAVLSEEASPRWDGARGFVHEQIEATLGGSCAGHTAYVCGPPAMIEACIRSLMKGRLFERDIYTERFVTVADGAAALARSPLFKRL